MNHIIAQGSPVSFIRFIQENPSAIYALVKGYFKFLYRFSPDLGAALYRDVLESYRKQMGESLTLPFDERGEVA